MAKVSLRGYNRDIGTLIDQGQLEEAVGHCNHILKTFPKHLETYQLLGKAYLEAKRYKDASDVFTRLLSAVPNDFVAHVGMSMIGDETENLDDAIWHMERAFEAQPSNTAVQLELQRLYGRRDGVQPPKIRMTSGALANMYIQGELYPQAIAELMSVEAKEPGRMDIQVLLAQAYFLSRQKVEASKIASEILAKSPYNLDANRILVTILPETSRAESTQVYRHRINALDPYAAFAKKSLFDTSDVADAAVNLERLDWQPGDTVFENDGNWSDASIQADDTSGEEPDWLKNADTNETNMDIDLTPPEDKATEPAADIPDFMRAAGWGTSDGTAEEPTSFFDSPDPIEEETDDVPIAQGEMPDWMKNIAPDQAELEAAGEEKSEMDDAMADDFINDLLGDDDDEKKEDASGLGDLGDLGTSSEEQDAAMNWLESLAANQGANPEELITDPNARTEDAPDWVQKATGTSEETVETPASTPAEETPTLPAAEEDDGDDMAWLNELGEDEATLDPVADANLSDDAPDWLSELGSEDTAPTEASTPASDDALDWLNELDGEEIRPAEHAVESTEALPDWLNEDTEETSSPPAPKASEADDGGDDVAWLNELTGDETPVTEEPAEASEMSATPPVEEATTAADAIADDTIGTLGTSGDDQDAAMNWLESLAANQGANPEELITDPNERTEAAPEWVEKAKTASGDVPAPEVPVEEMPVADEPAPTLPTDHDVPEWLREDIAEDDDGLPAWLQDDEETPVPSMSMDDTPTPETFAPRVAQETVSTPEVQDAEEKSLAEQAEAKLAHDAPDSVPSNIPEVPATLPVAEESAPASPPSAQEEAPALEVAPAAQEEENLPDWLQEDSAEKTAPSVSVAKPTKAEEWKSVTEDEKAEAAAKDAEEKATTPPEPEKTPASVETDLPPRRKVKRMNTTMLRDTTLMSGQAAMREGNISAALDEYGKLIKKKRLLDETIYDLREALYEYPVDVSIWQMLGDAHMRAGQLQEAINAYTKAEELLR